MKDYLCAAAAGFICLCLLGCAAGGSSTVTAKGKLLQAGQPLKLSTQVFKTMVLYPHEMPETTKGYATYPAMVQTDGTFEVAAIPPGKYRIVIELVGDAGDMCKGLFTKENSKLIRDVNGRDSIAIDITKPKGE